MAVTVKISLHNQSFLLRKGPQPATVVNGNGTGKTEAPEPTAPSVVESAVLTKGGANGDRYSPRQ